MEDADFEYDVAISFGQRDEGFANRLSTLLEGRLRVFLYSKEQEQLAGTDGEVTFNTVFGQRARLVVVLFREAWGQTPFTRFEETAIRNRAFVEGYDFTIFIPMDDEETQKVPRWLPKNRLYVGLTRWGIDGAAASIEARFSDLGGNVRKESVADLAQRTAREVAFKERRQHHLTSTDGVNAQTAAWAETLTCLLEAAPVLATALAGHDLREKHTSSAVALITRKGSLTVAWESRYSNTLRGSESPLQAKMWDCAPPWHDLRYFEAVRPVALMSLDPDLLPDGTAGWKPNFSKDPVMTSASACDALLKWFLAQLAKR